MWIPSVITDFLQFGLDYIIEPALLIIGVLFAVLLIVLHIKSRKLRNFPKIPENENSIVVITGCDTGFGRLTTSLLLDHGFHVISTVMTKQGEEELKDEAKNKGKGELSVFQLDITNQEGVEAFGKYVSEIMEASPQKKLRVLVNNAGIALTGPLEVQPINAFCKQIEVNLTGHIRVFQQFAAQIRNASGRVINVVSLAGRTAGETLGAYCASKFAMEGITDTMRLELAPWNVAVIAIEPGFMKTPLVTRNAEVDYYEQLWNSYPPHAKQTYAHLYERTKSMTNRVSRNASDPNLVVQAIYDAISSSSPKTRYLVGKDAKVVGPLRAILPDTYFDALIKLLF